MAHSTGVEEGCAQNILKSAIELLGLPWHKRQFVLDSAMTAPQASNGWTENETSLLQQKLSHGKSNKSELRFP
jgi:hypothetical protein